MAIQRLEIHGFRSFKDVVWSPGKLNLLVGPNGSGKSNLLRLLELISTAARGELQKWFTVAGGIIPILWDHQPGKCYWKVRLDPVDETLDGEKDALTYEMEVSQVGSGSAYKITRDTLGSWYKHERGIEKSPYWIFVRDARRAHYYSQTAPGLVPLEQESSDYSDGYDENESLLSQIADLMNRVSVQTKRIIGGWRIHHDIHAERGSPMRMPATTQFATRMEPDGENFVTVLHTAYTGNREFKKTIDEGMTAGFGDEYQELIFQPAAAQQIQLAIQWKSSSQPHAGQDLSDGTLRFLFLLTALANPEPPDLIAIDEPEAGLHPSMLRIIAEYAAVAAEKTQVIMTTHSPEFLDSFQGLDAQVTTCLWEDGQSFLYPLDAEMLEKWTKAYRLGQLFTRGDLDALALPPVEQSDEVDQRLRELARDDGS